MVGFLLSLVMVSVCIDVCFPWGFSGFVFRDIDID